MEALKTVLVANRGEIAVRLINGAKRLGIRTVAIHTEPDTASSHVFLADKAVLLEGPPTSAYLDIDQIVRIAKANSVQAVIPGYGFLSENPDFVRRLRDNNLAFVGPAPEAIESLGLKHTAREHAIAANVPVVPGSGGLLENEDEAIGMANDLGYPVMLKATAGGGGMGLVICKDEAEVRDSFRRTQERSGALFKNTGVFLERYYPKSHHIEVQVFGNGQGKAISVGERECSIQRRHQKVIEECPSPYVEMRHPELRKQLTECAVRFAESVNYASAGTIEFLVDDETGSYIYLEMNTRLQVEHGITELCYGVDLVELMYKQTEAELAGRGGLDQGFMEELQSRTLVPKGHAIELRLCAENPARNFAPSPGVLQTVKWGQLPGTRIDTWIRAGSAISASYDPLIGKIMQHSATREEAVRDTINVASQTMVHGPPNNLDFLIAILKSPEFVSGNTITAFLGNFQYAPAAIDVISGGAYTSVQDYPGRPTLGRGFGHAGPMDSIAFRISNKLVGNPDQMEALEITLSGPELKFLGDAVIALCGAPVSLTLDQKEIPTWTRTFVKAGQVLTVGRVESGARCYLSIQGGLPSVAEWFGSKATAPQIGIGGYQNRTLKAGDYLALAPHTVSEQAAITHSVPRSVLPAYSQHWDIRATGGPFEQGYLTPEDMEMVFTHAWKVSHNASRTGISLIGPKPQWARPDGGDGGSHPSNVIEYGYPIGGLNWTGDDPVILPLDSPNFGGFLCSLTVISADLWKIGQLQPGATVRFHRVSVAQALEARRENDNYLSRIDQGIETGNFAGPCVGSFKQVSARCDDSGLVKQIAQAAGQPAVRYLQGADSYLLVQYGTGAYDLNLKCRATALDRLLKSSTGPVSLQSGLINTTGCGTSLQIYYDGLKISQADLVAYLVSLESQLGDLTNVKIDNRTFRLPLTFKHKSLESALERYMSTQRKEAPYLPDPLDFVAKNNGISIEKLEDIFLSAQFVVVGVGFLMALPQCLPADPRHRINSPKMNPSRTFTPGGAVSWGGSCMALYNADGPGGYMITGMTIPGTDVLGSKRHFSAEKPWLYEDMDVITFYKVSEEEYDRERVSWESGEYDYKIEKTTFDMVEHNKLLEETKVEVEDMRAKQRVTQATMQKLEKESLARCKAAETANDASTARIETLLRDPQMVVLEAPVNAKVWRVEIKKGDRLRENTLAIIFEAMKLEINCYAGKRLDETVVEEVLVKPGDTVDGGKVVVIAKKS